MRRLPRGWLSRAKTLGKVGARLGAAGAQRLLGSDGADERLGDHLFEELDKVKGVAMKVGQILSYMEVGLPEATRDRLASIQHGQRGLEPAVALARLAEVLPAHRLRDFTPEPVAAASIGQVHRATLDGAPVAVKLRYPSIEELLVQDLALLKRFGRLASLGTEVDGRALAEDLEARFLEECDYEREAEAQERFRALLADDPTFRIPRVHRDHSGPAVLTTDWIDAIPFAQLLASPLERRNRMGAAMLRFPWTTLLLHHLLHADPHPGNFLFTDDRLVVLDFGCVRTFEAAFVDDLVGLVQAILSDDGGAIFEACVTLGLVPDPDRIDRDELVAMQRWAFAPYRCDRFCFTEAWWAEGQRFSAPTHPNLRHIAFPPAWMWIQRTFWGLHAVLTRLQVTLPARQVVLELLEQRSAVTG